MGYVCPSCGEYHEGYPDVGADVPDTWLEASRWVRLRSRRGDTVCEIRARGMRRTFLRGLVAIDVVGGEAFRYGVWSEVAPADFDVVSELWEDEELLGLAVEGTLDTELAGYPRARGLALTMRWRDLDTQPFFELHDAGHPLAREQREGISEARVAEITAPYRH